MRKKIECCITISGIHSNTWEEIIIGRAKMENDLFCASNPFHGFPKRKTSQFYGWFCYGKYNNNHTWFYMH